MNGPVFERIALIGVGLIGSSIAKAARARGLAGSIYGYSRRPETRAEIRDLGLCDKVAETLPQAVSTADLVILCTPVRTYGAIATEIGPHLRKGAVVSDVGSVKADVVASVSPHLREDVDFVPAHPIAGTAESGPAAGFAELFDNRWCIITPTQTATVGGVGRLTAFWQGLGADVEHMTPEHHDLVLALTSHLPHLIAYTIVGTATGLEDSLKSEVIKYSAGGFRDFTRIAGSDPTMWRDVFLTNRDAVLDVLSRFQGDLDTLRAAVEQGDGDALFDWFTRTRAVRRSVVDAGQAGTFDPREPDSTHLSDTGFLSLYGDG